MNDKLILNNGDIINVSEFSTLINILTICKLNDIQNLLSKLTTENLSHIQFKNKLDELIGEYYNMKLETGTYNINEDNINISISLREKSDLEKKMDEIELNQKSQGETIKELQEKIIVPE